MTVKVKLKLIPESIPLVEAQNELGPSAKELCTLVDEFETLSAKADKWKKDQKADMDRLSEVKKILGVEADEGCKPEDEGLNLFGTNIELQFGQKANSTEITDLALAKKLLGNETFLKIASIGIGDLKAYLTPEELAQCTKTERTGNRSMKVVKRSKPKK